MLLCCRALVVSLFLRVVLFPQPRLLPSPSFVSFSLPLSLRTSLAPEFTFCPARKLNPKAADMPSTAAGDTPAVMHAALQPSFTTKALA